MKKLKQLILVLLKKMVLLFIVEEIYLLLFKTKRVLLSRKK